MSESTPSPEDRLVTIRWAAQYAGVHPLTIRAAVGRGELRTLRVGKRLRFRRQDIYAYVGLGANGEPKQ